jgi:putative chitinase|tara:strand:+ start:297 stop:917 length:621 start_codon:yes stop_codon:yes gene_type:complete
MNDAMRKLQVKVGVGADNEFGPNTARAIASHYGLSPERGAHLLGQAAHESGGFKRSRENLNYSWKGLMNTWPTRFKTEAEAREYHRQPSKIARKVYLRKSLGNETEDDAEKFVGRGWLQLTGKANYRSFASDMGVPDVMTDPSLVEEDYAFETAQWFFDKNGLFEMADEGVTEDVIKKITKRVNGGYHGLTDRIAKTKQIHLWLNT